MNLQMSIASRAVLYLRVSTSRQAEVDLSILDQRLQATAYCQRQGWQVVAEYVEPGASAMDDQRAEFQRVIERASDDDRPFDVIVVHSFSRFFRDAFGLEMYIRRLAKHGVRLVPITQELGDDPSQVMMRQVIALFDEYQSRENAKHVLRAMKENARQGFYNGSRVPLGYAVEDVEKRGHRTKKRLVVDPVEAETVRLIFKLYLEGDEGRGSLGIQEIAKTLNARGVRTRLGARFGVGPVHKILTNPIYIGEWRFNRRHAKTGREKPVTEIIAVEVAPIIERGAFEEIVQKRATASGEVQDRVDQLSRQVAATEEKLRRLYALVEDGITDLDDVLKARLTDLKADRDLARSALDRINNQSRRTLIDRSKIERFGSLMRENITAGTIPFRKAYLRSLIDAVEVDDRLIRIHGSKATLEQAVIASGEPERRVRGFVRKWRSLGESNPCFSLERAAS